VSLVLVNQVIPNFQTIPVLERTEIVSIENSEKETQAHNISSANKGCMYHTIDALHLFAIEMRGERLTWFAAR
jgi:hypothetical protein